MKISSLNSLALLCTFLAFSLNCLTQSETLPLNHNGNDFELTFVDISPRELKVFANNKTDGKTSELVFNREETISEFVDKLRDLIKSNSKAKYFKLTDGLLVNFSEVKPDLIKIQDR